MRVIAPLLASLASVFTIIAAVVRIKWYRAKRDPAKGPVGTVDPQGRPSPPWVKTAAAIWLVLIVFIATIVGGIVLISGFWELFH